MLILRIKVAINVYNLKQKSEGPKLGAWRKLIIIFLLSREFSVQFRNFLIKLEWLEDQTWPLKTAKLEKKKTSLSEKWHLELTKQQTDTKDI